MQYVSVFFHICRKFEFLLSEGSVETQIVDVIINYKYTTKIM